MIIKFGRFNAPGTYISCPCHKATTTLDKRMPVELPKRLKRLQESPQYYVGAIRAEDLNPIRDALLDALSTNDCSPEKLAQLDARLCDLIACTLDYQSAIAALLKAPREVILPADTTEAFTARVDALRALPIGPARAQRTHELNAELRMHLDCHAENHRNLKVLVAQLSEDKAAGIPPRPGHSRDLATALATAETLEVGPARAALLRVLDRGASNAQMARAFAKALKSTTPP